MQSRADQYIDAAERIVSEKADYYHDPDTEKARLQLTDAQVRATLAIAAAVDRLAEALENLQFTIGR